MFNDLSNRSTIWGHPVDWLAIQVIPQKVTIDHYAKDGGPEVLWHLCSFYQDPLRSYLLCLVSYKAKIHRTASNGFTESLSSIWDQSYVKSQSYSSSFTIKEAQGKNYIKVKPSLVHHLLRNCLLSPAYESSIGWWAALLSLPFQPNTAILALWRLENKFNTLVNHLILLFKFFIYKFKNHNFAINIHKFKLFTLMFVQKVERIIAFRNNTLTLHCAKWEPILHILNIQSNWKCYFNFNAE